MSMKQNPTGLRCTSAALVAALLALAAPVMATEPPAPVSAVLPGTTTAAGNLQVALGNRADFQDLRVEFLSVPADTRCPAGTTCMSPGNAQVQVRVTQLGATPSPGTLLTLNTTTPPLSTSFGPWRLAVASLTPLPTAQQPNPVSSFYRLGLQVDKAPTLSRLQDSRITVGSTGVSTTSPTTSPTLNQQPAGAPGSITIPVGQSVTYDTRQIQFVSVLEDRRCPALTNCITPGNARIRLRVSSAGMSPAEVEINSKTLPTSVDVAGLTLRFVSLLPVPATLGVVPQAQTLTLGVESRIRR